MVGLVLLPSFVRTTRRAAGVTIPVPGSGFACGLRSPVHPLRQRSAAFLLDKPYQIDSIRCTSLPPFAPLLITVICLINVWGLQIPAFFVRVKLLCCTQFFPEETVIAMELVLSAAMEPKRSDSDV
jgi:hypothetical protein